MDPRRHWDYTIDEYVRLEERSNTKHEFVDGQIYAMSGGTPEHSEMAALVIAALIGQLRGRCKVHTADARIRVTATGLDTYPDVSVVCGDVQRDTEDTLAIVNPIVIVEITSKSTEKYDRGEKLEQYQRIATLREVVIISHREPSIEVWHHAEDDTWHHAIARAGEHAVLSSIAAQLAVDEIFRPAL